MSTIVDATFEVTLVSVLVIVPFFMYANADDYIVSRKISSGGNIRQLEIYLKSE